MWRRLWVALAESEKELGLGITDRQIEELKQNVTNLNLDVAHEREKVVRHDVMAQIYAYALQCPLAAPIIHLGATSCFVDDNADLISYYKALVLLRNKIVAVIAKLKDFANRYKIFRRLRSRIFNPRSLRPSANARRSGRRTLQKIMKTLRQSLIISGFAA